jgi:endonuclease/exonuclease/phosphatase family metal-dependent hydrolase
MSINLLVDRARPDPLRAAIADVDPDVLVVQELGPTSSDVIAGIFPYHRLDPTPDLFGLGIAATHRISVAPLHLEVRSGWIATLDPSSSPGVSAPLDVINVHLANPIDRPWKRSQATRRAQIAGVGAHVASSGVASVVVGDMNTTPRWPEYRKLTALGVDAARATGTAKRTWAHFTRGPRWIRIDHAFVAGARPLTTHTVAIEGSDHHALVVDIET